MKLILLLSGENLELARAEATALASPSNVKQFDNIILLDSEPFEYNRLAFTHKVCRYIFSCDACSLEKRIKDIDWQQICKGSFYVHTHGLVAGKAKELADIIWDCLKCPKVDIRNPETQLEFIAAKGKVFCGALLWENKERFNERRPHLRPGFAPTSMQPKLARALVNLSRIQRGKVLLDPFCGTGGILLEAALMGINVVGVDIDAKMLDKSAMNLEAFGIKGYKLLKGDATSIALKADTIVTDPPYGKASSLKNRNMGELYESFLENAYTLLPHKAYLVIVLPNRVKVRSRFRLIKQIDFYVHKNLTRTITVMKKP